MVSAVAQTVAKDQLFRGRSLLKNVLKYKVSDATIDAAQYAQNSPGNLARRVTASAMLVPASTEVPAYVHVCCDAVLLD